VISSHATIVKDSSSVHVTPNKDFLDEAITAYKQRDQAFTEARSTLSREELLQNKSQEVSVNERLIIQILLKH
jgi:hypothetical protein